MNEDGSNVVRLTNNTQQERNPAWSPDGSMIAFARADDCYYYYYYYHCSWDLFVMNADGSNERRLPTGIGPVDQTIDPSWSPDGHVIAFTRASCGYYCDLPAVWITDLRAGRVLQVTEGSNPVWKP
jgi:Tol biopolymer transport system component